MNFIVIECILSIILLLKMRVTWKNEDIILSAISDYHYETGIIDSDVYYSDMEPFFKSWLRLYDWGYTRMLPPEKYKLIEPFIKGDEIK